MSGVGPLLRFAARRDRVRLPLWVLLLAVLVVGTATSWDRLYPTAGERLQLSAILSANPALTALLGPLSDPLSTGALTAWRVGAGTLLVLGLINIFTVTRHARAEEQAGRAEMLMAAPFGRLSPLTAALLLALITDVGFVLIATALLAAVGLAPMGALLFAGSAASGAFVFAGVAAVCNQVFRSPRSANAVAGILLALSWALSGLGNIQQNALVWFSPFGWLAQTDPFVAALSWVVALAAAVALILIAVALWLNGRRDLAGGLIQGRRGPARAGARLTGVHSLAWRLERATVIGWVLGYALIGAFIGVSRDSLVEFFQSSPALAQIIERLGGSGAIIDVFLATYIGLGGVMAGFFAVAAVSRLESEETAGHAEPALASATARSRWLSSYALLAVVGSVLIMLAFGVVLGLFFGFQGGDGFGQVPRVVAAALSWLPPVLLMVGLTLALIGLVPRWTAAAWVVMTLFAVITEFGAVFGLPDWLLDLSPFSHVAKAPAQEVAVAPLAWITVAALLLGVAGYLSFRARDIATP